MTTMQPFWNHTVVLPSTVFKSHFSPSLKHIVVLSSTVQKPLCSPATQQCWNHIGWWLSLLIWLWIWTVQQCFSTMRSRGIADAADLTLPIQQFKTHIVRERSSTATADTAVVTKLTLQKHLVLNLKTGLWGARYPFYRLKQLAFCADFHFTCICWFQSHSDMIPSVTVRWLLVICQCHTCIGMIDNLSESFVLVRCNLWPHSFPSKLCFIIQSINAARTH